MVEILSDTASAAALTTLGAQTALAIEASHATGLLSSFLMKKVKASVVITGRTIGDEALLIGMARGDASVTQIKAAIEDIQLERDAKMQAAKRDVLFETLGIALPVGDGTVETYDIMVSLGGGKGIPFELGDGWQWFAYNMSSGSLTTGAVAHLQATYWGVWL